MKLSNSTEWLFFHLWKKNPENGQSCPSIRIPETIFFRWAQPYFWYNTDTQGNIERIPKDRIQMEEISSSFTKESLKCGVSAVYINPMEKKVNGTEYVQVEY